MLCRSRYFINNTQEKVPAFLRWEGLFLKSAFVQQQFEFKSEKKRRI